MTTAQAQRDALGALDAIRGDADAVIEIPQCRHWRFASDSESGTIEAPSFSAACVQLDAIVGAAGCGGWGWVEDADGYRYEVVGGE